MQDSNIESLQEEKTNQSTLKTSPDQSTTNSQLNTANLQAQNTIQNEEEQKASENKTSFISQSQYLNQNQNSQQVSLKQEQNSQEMEQNQFTEFGRNIMNFCHFLQNKLAFCKNCGNQICEQRFIELFHLYQLQQKENQVQAKYPYQPQTQYKSQMQYEMQSIQPSFQIQHQNQGFSSRENYQQNAQKEQPIYYSNQQQQSIFQSQNKIVNYSQLPKQQQVTFETNLQHQQQVVPVQPQIVQQNMIQGMNQNNYFYQNKPNLPGQQNFLYE